MKHGKLMYICAGLMLLAIVLVVAGADVLVFIPALGCALMMGMMVWMMVRPHGGSGRS